MKRLIDLKRYRIVDLSAEIRPGILKVNGEYVHGDQTRRLEVRQFIYKPDRMIMHWVDTETHIGTHVEGPSHHPEGSIPVSKLPMETFMGEAIVLNLTYLKPENGKGRPITPSDLEKVKKGDIVLVWSSYTLSEAPYLTNEVLEWVLKKEIKMLGMNDGINFGPGVVPENYLCLNNIPLVEGLTNLDEIRKERVFFIGLPIKIVGLDSSWIRAIALEELP